MINVAIIGYGNLGKGVEQALKFNPDMKLFGIFTRRQPDSLSTDGNPVYPYDDLLEYKDQIDVCILCGSSDGDLRTQTLELSKHFNCVDSFDIHSLIPQHVEDVNRVAHQHQTTSIVSVGWDPGLFSLQRSIFQSILPKGESESFWGLGVSQGHSQVVRSVKGVKMGIQYSIPNQASMDAFKDHQEIDASSKHKRLCYVVADEKDQDRIRDEIKNIEHYFKGTQTDVVFISEEEMLLNHREMPHGGHVLHRAQTSKDMDHLIDFNIKLDSNPEFTASVLVAYARAAYRMNERIDFGGYTVLDVKACDLSFKSRKDLIQELL